MKKKLCLLWIIFCYSSLNQLPYCQQPNAFQSGGIASGIVHSKDIQQVKEKVYLMFDRALYLSGEHAWFCAHLLNSTFSDYPPPSGVLYVDLINSGGSRVLGAKLKITDCRGAGELFLPDSLSTGIYIARAYTSWMKNFDPSLFFSSRLLIINRFDEKALTPDAYQSLIPATCQLFPEGGHLIYGINNKLVFHLHSDQGRSINCPGWIEDNLGAWVDTLCPIYNGMGSVNMIPQVDKTYFAVFQSEGNTYRFPLPNPQLAGYTLIAKEDLDGAHMMLTIRRIAENMPNQQKVWLSIQSPGNDFFSNEELIIQDQITKTIDLNKLLPGINKFLLIDDKQNVLAERSIFIGNPKQLRVAVEPDKKSYGLREKVSLNLGVYDDGGKLIPSNLSIAVSDIPQAMNVGITGSNIQSYLMLQSVVEQRVPESYGYFAASKESKEALDNLMISLQGEAETWSQATGANSTIIRNRAEKKGLSLSGRLYHKGSGIGVENIELLLASPDSVPDVNYTVTGKDGRFRFVLEKYYGPRELVIEIKDNPATGDLVISMDDPFYPISPAYDFTLPPIDSSYQVYIEKAISRINIAKRYGIQYTEAKPYTIYPTPVKCYGIPEYSLDPDNYFKLPNFEELIQELVPGVKLRKKGDSYQLQILNYDFQVNNQVYTMLVDGVPVYDLKGLSSWDSDKIRKIDVCYRSRVYGDLLMGGIFSLFSEQGNCPISIPGALYRKNWDGFYIENAFKTPEYIDKEQLESRKPDFRGTLYWNPEVEISKEGNSMVEFYTGDEPGTYNIVIEGITSESYPFTGVFPFIVTK